MVTSRRSPGSDENDTSSSVTAPARLLHNPMAITPTQTLSFLNIASLDPTTFCSCMFLSFMFCRSPASSFIQGQGARALDPTTPAVRNDFDQLDPGVAHANHPAIILAHVVTGADPVNPAFVVPY